ncbi:MAG TPA: glycosyltransferase [Steroidobacteraceae bacterium]|nr:glycosyltransferase [Steroidobacteraceae bacterium]
MDTVASKRALLIAFHYPPMRGSSGLQRALTFGNQLPDFGWQTTIVTAHPRAYPDTSADQLADIDPRVRVLRAQCWDAARHLSLAGRYPRLLATPDRWASWLPFGLATVLREIRRRRPQVIWSTFPIPTAHSIAAAAARISGLPWVADFRDSMTEENYPSDPRVRRVYRGIERRVIERASALVFTAPSTLRMYDERYPGKRSPLWSVVGNGFDERKFDLAASRSAVQTVGSIGVQKWLHSGLLDPVDRDPSEFLRAVRALKQQGVISTDKVAIVLRASGHDATYAPLLEQHGIADLVTLAPPIPYADALEEMLHADALLLFQARNCNHQIPAKLYEYIRAQRPVLCLTDPNGDTAREALSAGIARTVDLHNEAELRAVLGDFATGRIAATTLVAAASAVSRYSRRGQCELLASLFDRVAAGSPATAGT